MLQHLNIFLIMRGPKWIQHLSASATYRRTIPVLVLLATLLLILARMQLAFSATWTLVGSRSATINLHPQVLFFSAAFSQTGALSGAGVTEVQDWALGLVEPHTVGLSISHNEYKKIMSANSTSSVFLGKSTPSYITRYKASFLQKAGLYTILCQSSSKWILNSCCLQCPGGSDSISIPWKGSGTVVGSNSLQATAQLSLLGHWNFTAS